MKDKKRLPTDGGPTKWASPFAALQQVELPPTSPTRSVSKPG